MGSQKSREQRRIVMVKARMRVSADWVEVTICNVSSRGLMAKCADPPAKGSYIELRQRGARIIGRVAWAQGLRFGIRTQDRIDLAALLAEPALKGVRAQREQRIEPRKAPPIPVALHPTAQFERSRLLARASEWGAIVGISALAVGHLAASAGQIIGDPLAQVGTSLGGD
jgi:hypothetical protein